jgi:hypothetical protein
VSEVLKSLRLAVTLSVPGSINIAQPEVVLRKNTPRIDQPADAEGVILDQSDPAELVQNSLSPETT